MIKPTYDGFEAKRNSRIKTLPDVGAYVAEIQEVRTDNQFDHTVIEMMMEITEGEYKGRYHEVYKDQEEKFGNAKYKGVFRLIVPNQDDESWRRSTFEGNLWAVQQSNPGYSWDWDEKKLKGKKVGINVRKYLYTWKDEDRETTEIGQFEPVNDVREGKCKTLKPRDKRSKVESADSTDGKEFTDVSNTVSVPW